MSRNKAREDAVLRAVNEENRLHNARANDRQVGGDHYKKGGEEHWDRAWRLHYDPFQYIITKWIERWRDKGGVQDLKKAQHAIEKYIELVEAGVDPNTQPMAEFEQRTVVSEVLMTPPFPKLGELRTEAEQYGFSWEGIYGNGESNYKCLGCGQLIRARSGAEAKSLHTPEEPTPGYVNQ